MSALLEELKEARQELERSRTKLGDVGDKITRREDVLRNSGVTLRHSGRGSAVAMLPSRNCCFYFTNLCLLLVAIACLLYVLIGLIQQDKPMIL